MPIFYTGLSHYTLVKRTHLGRRLTIFALI